MKAWRSAPRERTSVRMFPNRTRQPPLFWGDCTGDNRSQCRESPLQQTKVVSESSFTGKPGGTAEIILRPCCG